MPLFGSPVRSAIQSQLPPDGPVTREQRRILNRRRRTSANGRAGHCTSKTPEKPYFHGEKAVFWQCEAADIRGYSGGPKIE
jgi:hypothetical protein